MPATSWSKLLCMDCTRRCNPLCTQTVCVCTSKEICIRDRSLTHVFVSRLRDIFFWKAKVYHALTTLLNKTTRYSVRLLELGATLNHRETATKPWRNHDETTTKPLDIYRAIDETGGYHKILMVLKQCSFFVEWWFRRLCGKMRMVSSWFRRGFVMVSWSLTEV